MKTAVRFKDFVLKIDFGLRLFIFLTKYLINYKLQVTTCRFFLNIHRIVNIFLTDF